MRNGGLGLQQALGDDGAHVGERDVHVAGTGGRLGQGSCGRSGGSGGRSSQVAADDGAVDSTSRTWKNVDS